MRGIEDIPMLWTALKAHGYDDALLQKMFYDNWLRVF
jgi:microsomal dipeptidase-like Zn-dependent dipeptidase